MFLKNQSIAVIGGGIAGLAVARACALREGEVTLYEQAPEITEVGAGLQVSPNGYRVIEALGLAQSLLDNSLGADAVTLRNGSDGRAVLRLDLAGRDYRFIHRARLIDVLAAGARDAGVDVRLGAAVDASEVAADIVIGADGLRSRTRAAILGTTQPRFTGQVAWRATIDVGDAPSEAQVFMGPGRHLVSYPLKGGLRNIVAVEERSEWADEGWDHRDDPDNLRAAFARFSPQVREWLDAVEDVHLWGLFRHPVAPKWFKGNLVLLGDAAHPTLPFLAQGANMALEDAWVLAAALDRAPLEQALPRYQSLRAARCARIVTAAEANARNYHLSNPAVRWGAHTVLRIAGRVAPDAAVRRFDWLYEYDATKTD